MEIIGDPQVFAVQLEWDRDPPTYKPWMFGVFCVFICGERLGSPTNQATLNSILAELGGWKESIGQRSEPALMAADPVTAFLSIEDSIYGLEHLQSKIPENFTPIAAPSEGPFEILCVDGLENYRLYCVEDETTSRLLYVKKWQLPRECRVPRAVLTNVLLRTIDTLDHWFQQLPQEPKS